MGIYDGNKYLNTGQLQIFSQLLKQIQIKIK